MTNEEIKYYAIEAMGLEDSFTDIKKGYELEELYYVEYNDGMFHCVLGNEECYNNDEAIVRQFIRDNAKYWR